jgi:hypothetical protein
LCRRLAFTGSWKLALATFIRNVGVLMQNCYLVAEMLGLSGCALGNGNTVQFAEIIGLSRFGSINRREAVEGGGQLIGIVDRQFIFLLYLTDNGARRDGDEFEMPLSRYQEDD